MTPSRRRPSAGPRTSPTGPAPAPEARPSPAAPSAKPAVTLDALGKKCPIPIIMLADRIREVRIGQTIEVLADDPAARTDVPAWCTLKSHEFVRASDLPVGWSFLIRRSY